MMCDTIGCDNKSEYYDPNDNKVCTDCMLKAVDEDDYLYEHFELIEEPSNGVEFHNEIIGDGE